MSKKSGDDMIDIPEIYANAALINMSSYEFEITLGLEGFHYDGVKPLANIRLNPKFVKQFLNNLTEKVEQYEKKLGEIK